MKAVLQLAVMVLAISFSVSAEEVPVEVVPVEVVPSGKPRPAPRKQKKGEVSLVLDDVEMRDVVRMFTTIAGVNIT